LQQLRTYRKRKQNLTSQVRLREVRSHRKCRHQCGKKHRSGRACRVSPWRDGKGRLDEAGTLRSDSGSHLNAVGIPFLQGGEDVNLSPIILSIILGILVGSTGLFAAVSPYPITGAFTDTLKLLGSMTQPLICIVIGYELHMQVKNIRKPLLTVLLRMCILMGIAFLLNTFLIDKALHLDKSFQLAVYTMFLLPPPFVIPIYMGESSEKQKPVILNTISLHVLFSLIAFVVLVSIM